MLWILYIQVSKRSQNKENMAPKAPKKRKTNTNWYCTIHFVCTAPLTLLSLFVGLLQGPASCQVCAHCIWVSSFQLAIHYPFHNLLWPRNTARWGVGTPMYIHRSCHKCAGKMFLQSSFSVQSERSAKMVEPAYFLLWWSIDGSLYVSTANTIRSGEKVVSGEVTTPYQRTTLRL